LKNKKTFIVLGKPFGQMRPRARKIGSFISMYSPKENIAYATKVIEAYQSIKNNEMFGQSPLGVKITAYFNRPKITKKELALNLPKNNFPCKKPDSDNIAKSILDSLNDVAYHDDAWVVDLQVLKVYDEAEERVMVEMWEL
jgi:Holliday junction resolvase RusA-like endonuclease